MEILQQEPDMSFDEKCARLETDGWVLAGHERLTETKFSKDAKFEEVHLQTEEEIITRYEQEHGSDSSVECEVQLVLNENLEKLRGLKKQLSDDEYRDIINNLREKDMSFLVFVRRKESN